MRPLVCIFDDNFGKQAARHSIHAYFISGRVRQVPFEKVGKNQQNERKNEKVEKAETGDDKDTEKEK